MYKYHIIKIKGTFDLLSHPINLIKFSRNLNYSLAVDGCRPYLLENYIIRASPMKIVLIRSVIEEGSYKNLHFFEFLYKEPWILP